MHLSRVTDATTEPITHEDVKSDLILTGTADDTLIDGYIKSSRQFIENYAKVSLFTQTWQVLITPSELQTLNALPRSPIQEITSVTWTDEEGVTTPVDPTDYRLAGDELILLEYEDDGYYTITYTAGFDDDDPTKVPEPFKIAIRIAATSHYENRESFVIPPGIRQLVGPLRRGRLP